jgi:large conductance mechanosensitive channel
MLDDFKKFIMRGSVIDLAVGFVVGAAFIALIGSFTRSFVDPIVRAVMGGGIEGGTISLFNDERLDVGGFLNSLITFVITLAVLYFVFVLPMNAMRERRAASEDEDPTHDEKVEQLLEQIAAK